MVRVSLLSIRRERQKGSLLVWKRGYMHVDNNQQLYSPFVVYHIAFWKSYYVVCHTWLNYLIWEHSPCGRTYSSTLGWTTIRSQMKWKYIYTSIKKGEGKKTKRLLGPSETKSQIELHQRKKAPASKLGRSRIWWFLGTAKQQQLCSK